MTTFHHGRFGVAAWLSAALLVMPPMATDKAAAAGVDLVLEKAETTDGAAILEQSKNVSCLRYEVVGICVWLTCTPAGCSVSTSVKVKHYTPDAVVTTYPVTGKSPWLEVQGYAPPTAWAHDGGANKQGSTVNNVTALVFKNADVIGSPGLAWIEALAKSNYFCKPSASPYVPYFLSTLDYAWRDPTLETPWTVANILRYVRHGLSTWEGVYPRIGFVHNTHDYKVGAVTAQRAADIVTRRLQPHLYQPLPAEESPGYWPPGGVIEGDENTHLWQQLIPSNQSGACRIFADQSDQGSGADDPFKARVSQISGYAFNLWLPYRCCERKGAVLIYHSGD